MTFRGESVEIWICTHNPNLQILQAVLSAACQERSAYENSQIFIINNNSNRKISDLLIIMCEELRIGYHFLATPGIAVARQLACMLFASDLLLFVDDDNVLEKGYLLSCISFFQSNQQVGAIGGKAFFPYGIRLSDWKRKLLPYVGIRDNLGESPIYGFGPIWGPYEPIGAGACIRRDVISHFLSLDLQHLGYFSLGRSGPGQLSGEDSFIMRQSYAIGLACAYVPSLSLNHFIDLDRLQVKRLALLLYSYGLSDVYLDNALKVDPGYPYPSNFSDLVKRAIYLVKSEGISGIFVWLRHVGQFVGSK